MPKKTVLLLATLSLVLASEQADVAVMSFSGNAEDSFLSEQIPALIEQRLARESGIRIQERRNLDAILQEMELAQTCLLSDERATEIAKLSQADYIIAGFFDINKDNSVVLNYRLLHADTGEVRFTALLESSQGFELMRDLERSAGMAAAEILGQRNSRITIDSRSGKSSVYLNGNFIGQTPVVDYPVTPGSYRLRISQDNYYPLEKEITVQPEERFREQADLLHLGYTHPDYALKFYFMGGIPFFPSGDIAVAEESISFSIGVNYTFYPFFAGAFYQFDPASREHELSVPGSNAVERRHYYLHYAAVRAGMLLPVSHTWLILAPTVSLGDRTIYDVAEFFESDEAPYTIETHFF